MPSAMLAWSPLLVQKIEIHALGFTLRRLQLNRHRQAEVGLHTHPHSQLLLYLSGEGWQTIARRRRPVRPGDLLVVPAGTPHGFSAAGRERPLCLVLDYDLAGTASRATGPRRLSAAALSDIHALLAEVPRKGRLTLSHYPAVLAVVARLLRPTPSRADAPPALPSLAQRLRPRLQAEDSLAQIARDLGFQRDYLNRKLKREAGLGLSGLRHQLRLERAQAALQQRPTIAEAALQAGFEDPNYFARWFRRQTGETPSAWRRRKRREDRRDQPPPRAPQPAG